MLNYKEKLKRELAHFLGLKNVVLFSSCRNALYTLLLSLNLKPTDEIIIQKFICGSLPLAIQKAGAKPVLVEVNEETFNLDASTVKESITLHTKAIIFVHTYGNPSGILEIKDLCEQHHLILIEDIAHALGARYNGRLAGTFGDYAVYSFTKQMVNVGGGAVITNHDVCNLNQIKEQLSHSEDFFFGVKNPIPYLKRLFTSLYETRAFRFSKILINFVQRKSYLNQKNKPTNQLGSHFQCSSIEAYLAARSIGRLQEQQREREKNYQFLKEKGVTMQISHVLAKPSYNYLSIILPDGKKRDMLLKDNLLFSFAWTGSKISDKVVFIPNNPHFRKRELVILAKVLNR